MTFEQKKARAIALMDSKKMWRSNYAPPLLRILWRLGIRLPPLPFMPFWQVTVLTGGLWGISGDVQCGLSTGGRQEWWQVRPLL